MSGIIGGAGSRSGVIGTTELDYEEGEWAPVFKDSAGATIGASVITSHYTKIGRSVTLQIYFNVTALQNGLLATCTLPFVGITSERTAGGIATYSCPITDDSSINNAVYIEGPTYLYFWRLRTNDTSLKMKVDNGSEIIVGITYFTP